MKIYSTTHKAIVEAPIMEKPFVFDEIYDYSNRYGRDLEAYEAWLSTHKQVPDEFKDYWADGQEVKDGIDYRLQHQVKAKLFNADDWMNVAEYFYDCYTYLDRRIVAIPIKQVSEEGWVHRFNSEEDYLKYLKMESQLSQALSKIKDQEAEIEALRKQLK
jgi:hypothetical protein